MNPKPLTLGSAEASNPARVRVSRMRYAWYYPKWALIWSLPLASCLVLVFGGHRWFLIPTGLTLVCLAFYWIRIGDFFKHGDANPGVVVGLNPLLVAVATDLTRGFGKYPAVKIIRTRLRRFMGEVPTVGMRLPTVSLYVPHALSRCPHWLTFDPRPLECGTGDRDVLERVMASFTREQYYRLEGAVKILPSLEPGLYRLLDHRWEKVSETSNDT